MNIYVPKDDPNVYRCYRDTGCCEKYCGPMENCQVYFSCPGDPYFIEWRK